VRKPVDEPVVTVYLRTGCQTQSTRKYVMLAEVSSDVTQLPVAGETVLHKPAVPVSSNSKNSTSVTSEAPVPVVSSLAKSNRRKSRGSEGLIAPIPQVAVPERPLTATATLDHPTKRQDRSDVMRSGARLKLQPLEISANWEPALRMTNDLGAVSSEFDANRRAEAAALWRVLNATPEEILQEAAKRAAMEAELQGLQTMSRANQAALVDLSQKLKAAQESRFANPLVYVLLALLLVCGAFVGYLLRQRHTARGATGAPWWKETAQGATKGAGDDALDFADQQQQRAWSVSEAQVQAVGDSSAADVGQSGVAQSAIDIPLSDFPVSSGPVTKRPSVSSATKPTDFGHSVRGTLRAINTQEMVDVRQQADFFLALGQYDEAIGLLHGALSQSSEVNPHIYLDLIALLHRLSRKDEYEKVRQAFNGLYTCHLPEFGMYSDDGCELIDYAEICEPLVKLWPTRSALDYIENCLVRTPSDAAETGFDLAAFKDLLLLHSVLGAVSDQAAEPGPSDLPRRVLPSLKSRVAESSHVASYLDTPKSGTHLDLDLS
jgi:Arc/MetJ-type ribon-helix-helix transcriptional regulator